MSDKFVKLKLSFIDRIMLFFFGLIREEKLINNVTQVIEKEVIKEIQIPVVTSQNNASYGDSSFSMPNEYRKKEKKPDLAVPFFDLNNEDSTGNF